MVRARRRACGQAGRAPKGTLPVGVPSERRATEGADARHGARRAIGDRRWSQRTLTGTSGATATTPHARPGQAAGRARRPVARRAGWEAGARPAWRAAWWAAARGQGTWAQRTRRWRRRTGTSTGGLTARASGGSRGAAGSARPAHARGSARCEERGTGLSSHGSQLGTHLYIAPGGQVRAGGGWGRTYAVDRPALCPEVLFTDSVRQTDLSVRRGAERGRWAR